MLAFFQRFQLNSGDNGTDGFKGVVVSRGAVACRGSWMPGANEVLGCPQVKNLCLLTFFSHFSKFVPSFINFFLDVPFILDARVVTFFLFIFKHLPLFLNIYLHFF